jgi:hypothetical protein
MGQVFDAISAREVELWDHQTVKLAHNLGQREDLFSDEALAELIENIDPAQLDITTMGDGSLAGRMSIEPGSRARRSSTLSAAAVCGST